MLLFFFVNDVYTCVSVCRYMHVRAGTNRDQKKSSDILGLQAVISNTTQVLRIELLSAKGAHILYH